MRYVTRKSHQIQKDKFCITYLGVHFAESVSVPAEHEKECIDVLHPGRTGMTT
jgi:hypothetical protein